MKKNSTLQFDKKKTLNLKQRQQKNFKELINKKISNSVKTKKGNYNSICIHSYYSKLSFEQKKLFDFEEKKRKMILCNLELEETEGLIYFGVFANATSSGQLAIFSLIIQRPSSNYKFYF